MATVKSASFTADLALKVQGDTAKMTDPTAKALLSQGVTFHAEGKSANDPTAVDMTMSLGIAGQNLEFGMMSEGKKSWVQYQGTWYALDAEERQGAATSRRRPAPRPPSSSRAWASIRRPGARVRVRRHRGPGRRRRSTTSRPSPTRRSWPTSLIKAAEDPSLQEQARRLRAASSASSSQGLTQNKQQAEELEQEPQGRHGRLLDRRRRPAHVQGAVRRGHGHVGPEGHAGRHRHDLNGTVDHGGLRRARRGRRRRPTRSRSTSS